MTDDTSFLVHWTSDEDDGKSSCRASMIAGMRTALDGKCALRGTQIFTIWNGCAYARESYDELFSAWQAALRCEMKLCQERALPLLKGGDAELAMKFTTLGNRWQTYPKERG